MQKIKKAKVKKGNASNADCNLEVDPGVFQAYKHNLEQKW